MVRPCMGGPGTGGPGAPGKPPMQQCHLPAGHCLLDKPPEWLQLPSALPGTVYPVLRQCQLAFGPDSRHCGDLQPPCASLWCTGHAGGRSVCQTKHFPWADGTPCAPGRACMDGLCVSIGRMQELTVSPGRAVQGAAGWALTRQKQFEPPPPIVFSGCRRPWMVAGGRGGHGAGARGPAAAASSSPTATAARQHLATVAGTARASAPASSPATWRSVLAAPVSGASWGWGAGMAPVPGAACSGAGGCRWC